MAVKTNSNLLLLNERTFQGKYFGMLQALNTKINK